MMSTRREFLVQAVLSSGVSAAVGAETPGVSKTASTTGRMNVYGIEQTDLVVTRLAFGCAMLGIGWKDPEFARKAVPVIEAAYEHGITYFDIADIYGFGQADLALAEVLRKRPGMRQSVVIQSKCGDRLSEGGIVDNSRQWIEKAVEGSLERLSIDHLDVLLLHWPDSLIDPDEVAAAFDNLHRKGQVRYFGVSNHSPDQIEILKTSVRQPLVVNQIPLGLASWCAPSDPMITRFTHGAGGASTLDYCRLKRIQVQAYSPLRGSDLRPSLLNPPPNAPLAVKQAAEAVQDLANKYRVGAAAIMLAWLLRHPAGIVPIIGTTKVEHVVENCMADRIDLAREEWYALLQAAAPVWNM